MKHLENVLTKFNSKSKKVLSWVTEKEEFIASEISEDIDIQNLRAKINSFGGFEQELQSITGIKEATQKLGSEITDEKHSSSSEISEISEKMNAGLDEISSKSVGKKKQMEDLLAKKLEIEQLCVEFAKNAETLTLFLEDCSLTLSEPVLASSVKDVEVLVAQIEEYSQKIKEIKHVLDKLVDIHSKSN